MAGRKLTPEVSQKLEQATEGGITPKEESEIRDILGELAPEELQKIGANIRRDLWSILTEMEAARESNEDLQPARYSMEWVKQLNDSKVFELFFERPEVINLYSIWIEKKISQYPYLTSSQTTVELTVWKHLVETLSFGGIGWYVSGKIGWFFSGKYESVKWALSSEADVGTEKPQWIDRLTSVFDSVQWVVDSFKSGEASQDSKKIKGFVKNIEGFVEDITQDYFQNIEKLDWLLKAQGYIWENGEILKPEIQGIFDNPHMLAAIWKTGEYEQDWITINIDEQVITVSPQTPETIEAAQISFMQEIWESTSKNGKKIDGLRKNAKWIAKLLTHAGIDANDLNGFKEWLAGFGPMGEFFSAIFSFFINGAVESELDKISGDLSIKKSLKNLDTFMKNPENIELLPFVPNKEKIEANGPEAKTVQWFLAKIQSHEESTLKKGEKSNETIIDDESFWKTLLSAKANDEGLSPVMKRVLKSVQPLKNKDSKLSQEEFFEKLAKISISQEKKDWPKTLDTPEKEGKAENKIADQAPKDNSILTTDQSKKGTPVQESENTDQTTQNNLKTTTKDADKKTADSSIQKNIIAGAAGWTIISQVTAPEREITAAETNATKVPEVPKVDPVKKWIAIETIQEPAQVVETKLIKGVPISEVSSLPAILKLTGREKPIKVGKFDLSSKQLPIDWKNYQVSDVISRDKWSQGEVLAKIEELWVKDGIPFIKIGGEASETLKEETLATILSWIASNGSHSYKSETKAFGITYKYKIDINPVL